MEKHYIIYGNRAEEMARAIMERMNISRELASLKKENPLVCLKPNLVVAQPAQWGVTTDPGLARGYYRLFARARVYQYRDHGKRLGWRRYRKGL